MHSSKSRAMGQAIAHRNPANSQTLLVAVCANLLDLKGQPGIVSSLRPEQRIWCSQAWYGREDQVPISLLAPWDVSQIPC